MDRTSLPIFTTKPRFPDIFFLHTKTRLKKYDVKKIDDIILYESDPIQFHKVEVSHPAHQAI